MTSEKQLAANRKNAELAGRTKGAIEETTAYAKAFKRYVAERVQENQGPLVDAMLAEALNGNIMAFNALLDRAHGKPAQAIDLGTQDNQPIVFMPLELIAKHSLKVIEGEQITPPENVIVNPAR